MLSSIKGSTQLSGLRIGLMGGSFNPPHEGHVHVSEVALRRFRLDQIWWLVSPQNPLKSTAEMASLIERIAQCRALVRNPHIKVRNIEYRLGTTYSIETIRALQTRFRRASFCWIMGADNLLEFHKWNAWSAIMERIPVAVVARPGYHLRAGLSKTATRFHSDRLDPADAPLLVTRKAPAWTMVLDKLHPLSSTSIRETRSMAAAGAPEQPQP